MISFGDRCYSNQYDEISDDEFSDDEISGFANTTKFLTTKFPPPPCYYCNVFMYVNMENRTRRPLSSEIFPPQTVLAFEVFCKRNGLPESWGWLLCYLWSYGTDEVSSWSWKLPHFSFSTLCFFPKLSCGQRVPLDFIADFGLEKSSFACWNSFPFIEPYRLKKWIFFVIPVGQKVVS